MKFYFFHLMPYAALDLDYDQKHDAAWVTLPNSYYDPKIGHQLYNRYLDEIEFADEVGFDGVCVNEHHQNAYGIMPIPSIMAGALARRTKNVRIAVLGRALPLLNNPLVVAEEYAMLDNITGGRLVAGFVRGIGAEYHSFGANPAESHGRFHEAHDLIIQAWTRPGPFPFEGKYYHLEYVNTWPRCFQQPHPPIWIPSQGSRETIEWASHPDRKYTYLQTFSPVAALARYMAMYRECADRYGYTATPEQVGWSIPLYVAETDAIAHPRSQAAHRGVPQQVPAHAAGDAAAARLSVVAVDDGRDAGEGRDRRQADHRRRDRDAACSCAAARATLREKIEKYQKEIGFGYLLPMMQFGTLPHDLTIKSTEIFGKEVIPYFRGRPDAMPARAEPVPQGA